MRVPNYIKSLEQLHDDNEFEYFNNSEDEDNWVFAPWKSD